VAPFVHKVDGLGADRRIGAHERRQPLSQLQQTNKPINQTRQTAAAAV
jgi:hypothetical protein